MCGRPSRFGESLNGGREAMLKQRTRTETNKSSSDAGLRMPKSGPEQHLTKRGVTKQGGEDMILIENLIIENY